MGWFGISNSANRSNNVRSMAVDINAVNELRSAANNLHSAVDYQLGRAQTLSDLVHGKPDTHRYSRNDLSATAAQLAAELRTAIQDGQQFRNAVSNLCAELNHGAELIEHLQYQYDLPRGSRTIRFGVQNVPPSGQEMAVWSESVAVACVQKVCNTLEQNQSRVARTFSAIEKADHLVTGTISSAQRPDELLRQLLES